MSEKQPPESPNSNKSPQGASPEGGVNWKVIILFTVAIAIIYVAFSSAGDRDTENLTFPEFRDAFL